MSSPPALCSRRQRGRSEIGQQPPVKEAEVANSRSAFGLASDQNRIKQTKTDELNCLPCASVAPAPGSQALAPFSPRLALPLPRSTAAGLGEGAAGTLAEPDIPASPSRALRHACQLSQAVLRGHLSWQHCRPVRSRSLRALGEPGCLGSSRTVTQAVLMGGAVTCQGGGDVTQHKRLKYSPS